MCIEHLHYKTCQCKNKSHLYSRMITQSNFPEKQTCSSDILYYELRFFVVMFFLTKWVLPNTQCIFHLVIYPLYSYLIYLTVITNIAPNNDLSIGRIPDQIDMYSGN